jgi:hypothetical protein
MVTINSLVNARSWSCRNAGFLWQKFACTFACGKCERLTQEAQGIACQVGGSRSPLLVAQCAFCGEMNAFADKTGRRLVIVD